MFKNREKIIQRVQQMSRGESSPSRRYWCVTCKMLFDIDGPVCPYMPKVCINTPIPVELIPPESTVCLEKFGLFYPKIPQKVMAFLASSHPAEAGRKWAGAYLEFLKDWRFEPRHEPLQALKSFLITASGCETAQRVRREAITFVITDPRKIWDPEPLFELLNAAVEALREPLGIHQAVDFDAIDIVGDAPLGKYFCGMCGKFFEFSIQKESVTCPLMAQKCMAVPTDIAKARYSLEHLVTVYGLAPDIYKRMIQATGDPSRARGLLKRSLEEDWRFEVDEENLGRICGHLGITA